MSAAQKKLYLTVLYSKKAIRLLKLLYSVGAISNFYFFKSQHNKKLLKIFPIFYKKIHLTKYFRVISTPSRTFFITWHALCLLHKRTFGSVYFVSTSEGLISHQIAIKKHLGGVLVGFFFN